MRSVSETAEQCNAAIDFNAYRHERSCHYLIILLLPARIYASLKMAVVVSYRIVIRSGKKFA